MDHEPATAHILYKEITRLQRKKLFWETFQQTHPPNKQQVFLWDTFCARCRTVLCSQGMLNNFPITAQIIPYDGTEWNVFSCLGVAEHRSQGFTKLLAIF